MLVQDAAAELWSEATVKCVLVPRGHQVEVELRNADGSAFLRKAATSRQAAVNEAEYLRLLLLAARRPGTDRGLKPFALVIENDREHHDACASLLRVSGVRALTCRRGLEGVALARDLAPDLIIIDASLTGITMREAIDRLRESFDTARIPIIAVAGAAESRGALRADAVLTRPCTDEALLAAVRVFVRHLPAAADACA